MGKRPRVLILGGTSEGAALARGLSEQAGERLDVLTRAGVTYYELALSRALYRVLASNLERTLDHLELARLRNYVGYSGREEILRWESQAAESRTDLFRARRLKENIARKKAEHLLPYPILAGKAYKNSAELRRDWPNVRCLTGV